MSTSEQTPWGWIVAIALAAGLALVAAFVFGRRAAARKQWRASAVRACTDGDGLHEATLTVLIAAASDNQPTTWSPAAGGADALLTDLQTLEASAPNEHGRQSVRAAHDAVAAVRSEIAAAAAAPAGTPLDQTIAQALRFRLDDMTTALRNLGRAAEN
jgi:hypothetical protein